MYSAVRGSLLLRGVYVPLITPYAPDGSVDLRALGRLAKECLDAGATGLVALGTMAEHPLLRGFLAETPAGRFNGQNPSVRCARLAANCG